LGELRREDDASRRAGARVVIAVCRERLGCAGRGGGRVAGQAGEGCGRVLGRLIKALGGHRARGTVIEHGREIDARFPRAGTLVVSVLADR
jgi:hypothetical protein